MLTQEQLIAQLSAAELRLLRDARPGRCDDCDSMQGYTELDPVDAELRDTARVVRLCARCSELRHGDV